MSNWNRDGFWIWAFDCFISLPDDSFDSVTVNDAVVDDVVDWIDCFNDLVLESRPDDDKVVIVFSAESIFGMGSLYVDLVVGFMDVLRVCFGAVVVFGSVDVVVEVVVVVIGGLNVVVTVVVVVVVLVVEVVLVVVEVVVEVVVVVEETVVGVVFVVVI